MLSEAELLGGAEENGEAGDDGWLTFGCAEFDAYGFRFGEAGAPACCIDDEDEPGPAGFEGAGKIGFGVKASANARGQAVSGADCGGAGGSVFGASDCASVGGGANRLESAFGA